jgi:hypothetical protein
LEEKREKKTQTDQTKKRPKKDKEMQNQKSPNPTQPKPKPESIPSKSDLLGAKPVTFSQPTHPKPSLSDQPEKEREPERRKKRSQQKFQKTAHHPPRDISVRHKRGVPAAPIIPSLRHELSMSQTLPIGSSHKNPSAKANSSVP